MAKAKAPPTPQSAAPPSGMRGVTSEGDVFQNIDESTIINRSNIQMESSFLSPELSEIAEILTREGNTEAIEIFNTFTRELGSRETRKAAAVQVLWRALVEASPGVREAMPRFHHLNLLLA